MEYKLIDSLEFGFDGNSKDSTFPAKVQEQSELNQSLLVSAKKKKYGIFKEI